MPTPPITDELLRATLDVRGKHASNVEAAAALGIDESTLRRRLARAAERGLSGTKPVMPGYMIKSVSSKDEGGAWIKQTKAPGETFEMPAGQVVKGISALVDQDGREVLKWVKTRTENSAIDIAETLKAAFKDYAPAAIPTAAPVGTRGDLVTLIPCNDWHVGMFAWSQETDTNWDLKIAERVISSGIEEAIARSPASRTAIVLGGGDLTHADNNENRTARSKNVLDVDGRHTKVVETAGRLMVRTIDCALTRADDVLVRILKGNHDEETAPAIAWFLHAWYRNEPRVTVDLDKSLFFHRRFGKVMISATHGHAAKLQDMPQIMAHRRAADWGASVFRYAHGFHVHHRSKLATEGGGVVMESHQAPIPQDAWHFGSGFLSGRSLQTITYHEEYGEISRVRVAMLDAANDNHLERIAA